MLPLLGGISLTYILVKSVIELANPANSASGTSWYGIGPPLVITIVLMVIGVVLMALQWRFSPAFFRQKAETAPPELLL